MWGLYAKNEEIGQRFDRNNPHGQSSFTHGGHVRLG